MSLRYDPVDQELREFIRTMYIEPTNKKIGFAMVLAGHEVFFTPQRELLCMPEELRSFFTSAGEQDRLRDSYELQQKADEELKAAVAAARKKQKFEDKELSAEDLPFSIHSRKSRDSDERSYTFAFFDKCTIAAPTPHQVEQLHLFIKSWKREHKGVAPGPDDFPYYLQWHARRLKEPELGLDDEDLVYEETSGVFEADAGDVLRKPLFTW